MITRESFVAREHELGRLNEFLDSSLKGQGQVCFVTGEAGAGKTALIREFAVRAQAKHDDLIVAVGSCDSQTGTGDPYSPFREVLSLLTGDVDAKAAQGSLSKENARRLREFMRISGETLVEFGPDLIDMFVPGSGLVVRATKYVAGRAGWLDKLQALLKSREKYNMLGASKLEQGNIFQQYENVLMALAAKQPLVIMLEDLHWIDRASADLLFRLGRRIGASRILLLGTYRPEEVAREHDGERHPMEKWVGELKRYYGDVFVDLDRAIQNEGQPFVTSLLNAEPNEYEPGFAQAFFQHTMGNPLFSVELLHDMQERGYLLRNAIGNWIESPTLKWDQLPARVEGVIAERIARLEEELRYMLTIGSVEGEIFTAEVISRVQTVDARGLVRQLSEELDKRHHLVRADGIERIDNRILSHYQFRHNLFQRFMYSRLDEVERTYLHQDVGEALEQLYGERASAIAVQLARHFGVAKDSAKAAQYLRLAGEQAAAGFASKEAVDYLTRALELTPVQEPRQQYSILSTRQRMYDVLGDRDAQYRDLQLLQALVDSMNDDRSRAEVAMSLSGYLEAIGDLPNATAAAWKQIGLAQSLGDKEIEATGYVRLGSIHNLQSNYDGALADCKHARELAQEDRFHVIEAHSLNATGVNAFQLGNILEAEDSWQGALAIFREIDDRQSEVSILNRLGLAREWQGDYVGAKSWYERSLALSRRIGDRYDEGFALGNLGSTARSTGYFDEAYGHLEEALVTVRTTGNLYGESIVLIELGDWAFQQGMYETAREYYETALHLKRRIGERRGEGVVLSCIALLLCHIGSSEAGRDFSSQALTIALEVKALGSRAFALTALGHALVQLGQSNDARLRYQEAYDLRRAMKVDYLAMEPLAGLARVSLLSDEQDEALKSVEEISAYLAGHSLDGTDETVRIYLTCYRVLKLNRDDRARSILTSAYKLLMERADRISDQARRQSYLERISYHRELITEYRQYCSR